ncbi:dihydrofolate reductase [Enterovirga rhinocerotis]|uniref:Dihydrofolate reductase n=1 Tax=Enterovirga rhinocerotis TaxID=1339210 RepID=A0A4R7BR16_9HYPH|nr:dihydrofolate reductase [Enterovirga rhinocerotis]TDR88110.1 dihydrofolate reductase [Enterovirga rhinocerotis]
MPGGAAGLPLVAVVAVAENGVIGRENDLPWRLRTDLRRFRAITMGKPLIIGRRNWDSIGRPLPGRDIIVMTKRRDFAAEGVDVVHGWGEARRRAAEIAARTGAAEAIVGGGAEIYRLAMPEIDALRLTRVHARPEGDVHFPAYDERGFREVFREEHPAGPQDDHAFTFIDLVRPVREGETGHRDSLAG